MSVKNIAMAAQKRDGTGKGSARANRRENKIPAVIYGNNQSPVTITLDEKAITMAYHMLISYVFPQKQKLLLWFL